MSKKIREGRQELRKYLREVGESGPLRAVNKNGEPKTAKGSSLDTCLIHLVTPGEEEQPREEGVAGV
jgi:hypothetical protein